MFKKSHVEQLSLLYFLNIIDDEASLNKWLAGNKFGIYELHCLSSKQVLKSSKF